MSTFIKCAAIVALAAVYAAVLAALMHPHVSAEYRSYFIDRTSSDYNPPRYDATPEQGIDFSRPGLPDWVRTTRGFSNRDSWGRWTDDNLGTTASLSFVHAFNGDVCIDVAMRAVPWMVGQELRVWMGGQESTLRVTSGDLTEYRVQRANLQGADHLDLILPPDLPPMIRRVHSSQDERRLGVNLATLKLIPGECPSQTD